MPEVRHAEGQVLPLLIDGQWRVSATERSEPVYDPASGSGCPGWAEGTDGFEVAMDDGASGMTAPRGFVSRWPRAT